MPAVELAKFLSLNPNVDPAAFSSLVNDMRNAVVEGVIAETAGRVVETAFAEPAQAAAPAYSSAPQAPQYQKKSYGGGSYGGGKQDKSALLDRLLANPSAFYDNRRDKKNPKGPDFKDKSTGEAIWLNDAPAGFQFPDASQF
jgi:hypothetical protein